MQSKNDTNNFCSPSNKEFKNAIPDPEFQIRKNRFPESGFFRWKLFSRPWFIEKCNKKKFHFGPKFFVRKILSFSDQKFWPKMKKKLSFFIAFLGHENNFQRKNPDSGNRFFGIRNSGSGMAFLNSLFEGEQKLLVSFFDCMIGLIFIFFLQKKTLEASLCGLTSTLNFF